MYNLMKASVLDAPRTPLRGADIPREKKVFIWKGAVKEIRRPATVVVLQILRSPGAAGFSPASGTNPPHDDGLGS